jgi:hypothetical protein
MTEAKKNEPHGPMTTDAERADATESLNMLGAEVNTVVDAIVTTLNHLVVCASTEHRQQCTAHIARLVNVIMQDMRTVGWLEERMVPGLIQGTELLTALKADAAAREDAAKAATAKQANDSAEGSPSVQSGQPVLSLDALFAQQVLGQAPAEQPAQTRAEQLDGFDISLAARVTTVGSGTKQ